MWSTRPAIPLPVGRLLIAVSAALLAAGAGAADAVSLVVCAPGYPSSTEQAQPSMDALADQVGREAGWPDGTMRAVYHPALDGGLSAMADGEAALALVPLPFYLEYRERLDLQPLLGIETTTGADEVWSVVARSGAVGGPADLGGWELVGMPGYSPAFVRHVALADWGPLPEATRIAFDGRVLGALRRAARGEPVAALLDRVQAESLGALPFGGELTVVARSNPLPGSLVCRIGDRLGADRAEGVRRALIGLERSEGGVELLESLRLRRFVALDRARLEAAERAFARGGPPSP